MKDRSFESINSSYLARFLKMHRLNQLKREPLGHGISNNNFILGNKYVLKVPFDKKFIMIFKENFDLENLAAEHFISTPALFYDEKNGYLVTDYLKGYVPIVPSQINLVQIRNIAKTIKEYQQLQPQGIKALAYEKMLDHYRLMISPKDRIYIEKLEKSPLLSKNDVLTHFDMVDNNILSDANGDIRLIDFEFACMAPKFFDLVSLLSENIFSIQSKNIIIDEYFQTDVASKKLYLKEEDELTAIFSLLWYHWAKARMLTDNEDRKKAFSQIAIEKKTALLFYLSQTDATLLD